MTDAQECHLYAFSGLSQSGKTTVALEVVSRLRRASINAFYVSEPVRDSQHYFARNFSPDLCLEVFSLHLLLESRSRLHGRVLILDRCLLDLISYFGVKYADRRHEELFCRIERFSLEHAASYRHVFFFREAPIDGATDPFQGIDIVDGQLFTAELDGALRQSGVDFTEVSRGNAADVAMARILNDVSL